MPEGSEDVLPTAPQAAAGLPSTVGRVAATRDAGHTTADRIAAVFDDARARLDQVPAPSTAVDLAAGRALDERAAGLDRRAADLDRAYQGLHERSMLLTALLVAAGASQTSALPSRRRGLLGWISRRADSRVGRIGSSPGG